MSNHCQNRARTDLENQGAFPPQDIVKSISDWSQESDVRTKSEKFTLVSSCADGFDPIWSEMRSDTDPKPTRPSVERQFNRYCIDCGIEYLLRDCPERLTKENQGVDQNVQLAVSSRSLQTSEKESGLTNVETRVQGESKDKTGKSPDDPKQGKKQK